MLTWCTDDNPARRDQVERLGPWLKKKGYPAFAVQLDIANSDDSKKIIQGVSGVGDDLVDIGDEKIPYFRAMGLLHDLTEDGAQSDPGRIDRVSLRAQGSATAAAGRSMSLGSTPCSRRTARGRRASG